MKLKDFDLRIWDSQTHKFVEVLISQSIRAMPRHNDSNDSNDKIEIELWSGFYDSKGAKIYEGDIVKYNKQKLVVVFEKSTFYTIDTSIEKHLQVDCGTRLQGIYENRSNGYTNKKLECLKVLGNIHENAELLKEGK